MVGVVFNGNNSQITYLPNCTAAVGYADYSVAAARDFDLRQWDYYKVSCGHDMHAPLVLASWRRYRQDYHGMQAAAV